MSRYYLKMPNTLVELQGEPLRAGKCRGWNNPPETHGTSAPPAQLLCLREHNAMRTPTWLLPLPVY